MQPSDPLAPLDQLQKSRIRCTVHLDTEEFLALQWALHAIAKMPLPSVWPTRAHRDQYEAHLRELSVIASKMDDTRLTNALKKASHRTALVPIANILPADHTDILRAAEEAGLFPGRDRRDEPVEPVRADEGGEL